MEPDLSIRIGNIRMKNPIMPASGTFGYGKEMADCFNKLFGRLIRLALYAILVHLVIDQKLIGLS